MTVKELITKLLDEDMNTEVQLTIDDPHNDKHGRCEGYVFNIDSVAHEYGTCMIKFTDWRKKNEAHELVGKWNTTPNPNHSPFDSTSEVIYMCSECAYSSGERVTPTWNYCPNCGADMRKEGEEK